MKKMSDDWRFLDHTADIRMEVKGKSLKDLFINAARGFTQLLSAGPHLEPTEEFLLELETIGVEELLVDWLRELLYRHQTQGFLFAHAEFDRISRTSLKAGIHGTTRTPDDEPELEIKAVTYHGLSVTKDEDGFSARVIFDI